MAREIKITKMVASGNDFVVIEDSPKSKVSATNRGGSANHFGGQSSKPFIKKICDRKYGAGADGVLLLGKSRVADVRMRIFNADGSEAQMCGNGARCVALYKSQGRKATTPQVKIETKAGIIESEVSGNNVKIRLTDPKNIKLDLPVRINGRSLRVNFINTGVPHAVIFVNGMDKIDIPLLGRQVRYHRAFAPAGTNVDFTEIINNDSIRVRTYERGVEDETLACGTGSVAASLIFTLKAKTCNKINAYTRSGEVLKVYFDRTGNRFTNVWLEGEAGVVYRGVYYV